MRRWTWKVSILLKQFCDNTANTRSSHRYIYILYYQRSPWLRRVYARTNVDCSRWIFNSLALFLRRILMKYKLPEGRERLLAEAAFVCSRSEEFVFIAEGNSRTCVKCASATSYRIVLSVNFCRNIIWIYMYVICFASMGSSNIPIIRLNFYLIKLINNYTFLWVF